MAVAASRDLPDFLLNNKLISPENLKKAHEERDKTGESLLVVIQKNKYVNEENLVKLVGEKLNIPTTAHLSVYKVDPQVVQLVSGTLAEKYSLLPLYKVKNNLTVAMVDPWNLRAVEEIERRYNLRVEPVMASYSEIKKLMNRYFGVFDAISDIVASLDETILTPAAQKIEISETLAGTAIEGPISKIINLLLTQAVRENASDIHLEAFPEKLRVRYRVDGLLRDVMSFPKSFTLILVSSLKILSKLDIAEKRLPQEGSFQVTVEGRVFNLRVASFPMLYGEKVVIRILEKEATLLTLEQLGFPQNTFKIFWELITKPHGIILVTGPTGSGKTTTLYAVLNKINNPTKNVLTIEDPIEYQIEAINQAQINLKAGLTFARSLRSFLRQDPDIVLVGEIRDLETAESAIQAAQTGHMVFSTLHTNDAPGAINRLIDMGMEPFLIASALEGVLAQRLVRLICENCKKPYEPAPEILEWLGLAKNKSYQFYKGAGCKDCNNTGYRGRTGIFELMNITEKMRNLITARVPTTAIRELARGEGMKTLLEEGIAKVLKGQTTVEEVMRVCKESEK